MIKIRHLVLSYLLFSGLSASAGVLIETRWDYDTATFNKDAKGVLGLNNSKIYTPVTRFFLKGNVNESLKYGLRFAVTKDNSTTLTKRDSLGSAVDLAFITHNIMPELAFTMGRFWGDATGFFGQNSPADRYVNPVIVMKWWSLYNNAFVTGARLAYTFLETHEVNVQLLNHASDHTEPPANTIYKGQTAGMGVAYKGSIMDKSLNFIASHHAFERDYVASDKLRKESITSAGMLYKMAPLAVGLDYNMGKSQNYTTTKDKTISGFVLHGSYTVDQFTPKLFLSSEKDVEKVNSGPATADVKIDYLRWGLAVEYKPFADLDFRYHVAYTQQSQKADSAGAVSLTETHVIAGMKLSADVLK